MHERVFVVSDLHLGGAPSEPGSSGFQMCMPDARRRLAEFFRWAAAQCSSERCVRVVLAGDIVDFLAEEDPLARDGYAAFTADENAALFKLERVFRRTEEVWDALAQLARSGAEISLLLGNHDVELALPRPRRALLQRLAGTRVEFLHNGEGLPLGPILIEHGNRCDPWNQVDHATLRELCSEQSRRESSARRLETPGSELVVRVMNKLKREYGFIDLLKPETSAVLPLLAVLKPQALAEIETCAGLLPGVRRNRTDRHGKPRDRRNISAPAAVRTRQETSDEDDAGQRDLALARELSAAPVSSNRVRDGRQIGVQDTVASFVDIWRAVANQSDRRAQAERLQRALRRLNRDHESFHVEREHDRYLAAARAAVGRQFKLVVFGHTHLPKRVPLGDGCTYFNTGTWADLIRVPEEALREGADGVLAIERFCQDLAANQLAAHREQHPTFVKIERGAGDTFEADLYWFWRSDRQERIPDGPLPRRLAEGPC